MSVPGLRMLEYMDAGSLDLIRPSYSDIPRNARAALLIEQQVEDESEYEAWDASFVVSECSDRRRPGSRRATSIGSAFAVFVMRCQKQ